MWDLGHIGGSNYCFVCSSMVESVYVCTDGLAVALFFAVLARYVFAVQSRCVRSVKLALVLGFFWLFVCSVHVVSLCSLDSELWQLFFFVAPGLCVVYFFRRAELRGL